MNRGRFLLRSEMKKNKTLLFIFWMALFLLCMYLINRDLFHYEYTFPFTRVFTPEVDPKGNYLLTEQIPLKSGMYQFTVEGYSDSVGNGCFIVDSVDETIFEAEIPKGVFQNSFDIEILKNTAVRAGFRYDPGSGELETNRITFISDHVLFKESVLRHAVISLTATLVFIYIGLRLFCPDFPEIVQKKTGIDLYRCEKIFLLLFLLTILSSWPLFDPNRFTEGDDFYFQLSRIEGIALTLKAGYFPPRILLGWMGNYGVGSEFYYPGLFMLLPASLVLCGFSSITALKIFLFICAFFSLLTVFLTGRRLGGDKPVCGACAAVFYAFASYRLICVFFRNAVGEVQAFVFYPLIVWGLFEILRGNTKKWGIFALGFWGLLMSHMISLAISGVLCALYLLFSLKKIIGNRDILFALIKAAVLTLLLGAFFLLPMFEQLTKNELRINTYVGNSDRDWDKMWFYSVTKFSNLFLPFDHWSIEGDNWIAPHPGWIILSVPLIRLFLLFRRKDGSDMKKADVMMLIGVLLLVAATDLFPWRLITWLLLRIQFTWRMLGPAAVLLSLAGGVYLEAIIISAANKRFVISVFLAAAMLSALPDLLIVFREKMYPVSRLDLSNKIIHGAEYMPPDFDPAFIDFNKDRINTDEDLTHIFESRRRKLGFVFSFEHIAGDGPVSYSVPLVYIYGYKADLTDQNGNRRPIPVSKDGMGLILVSDEGVPDGTIRINYQKTTVQKISEVISYLTLAVLIVWLIRKSVKRPLSTGH